MSYALGAAPGLRPRMMAGRGAVARPASVAGCATLPYALRSIYERETDPQRIAALWSPSGELMVAFVAHLRRAAAGPRAGCTDSLPDRDKATQLWLLRSCMALRLNARGYPTPWAPPPTLVRTTLESAMAIDRRCRRMSLRGDQEAGALGALAGTAPRWWQVWTLKQFADDPPGWQWAGWMYASACHIAHLQNIENNCYATVDKARIAIRTQEGVVMDVGRLRRVCSGVEVL